MFAISISVLNEEQTKKNMIQTMKKYRLFLSDIDSVYK